MDVVQRRARDRGAGLGVRRAATSLGATAIWALGERMAQALLSRARKPVSRIELHDGDRVVKLIKPTVEDVAQQLAEVMKSSTNTVVIHVEH